jgi:hypothetical protein
MKTDGNIYHQSSKNTIVPYSFPSVHNSCEDAHHGKQQNWKSHLRLNAVLFDTFS